MSKLVYKDKKSKDEHRRNYSYKGIQIKSPLRRGAQRPKNYAFMSDEATRLASASTSISSSTDSADLANSIFS